MFKGWKFRQIVLDNGKRVVDDWYENQSEQVQGNFDATLDILEPMTPLEWRGSRYVKKLTGDGDGLTELRYTADRKEYRALGIHNKGHEFIILVCCYHKDQVYMPKNAIKTAQKRRQWILRGMNRSVGYETQ